MGGILEGKAEVKGEMSVAEFQELGLLQEVNRRLLHRMGLALSVIARWRDPGDPSQGYVVEGWGPIIDHRDSRMGMRFGEREITAEEHRKADAVAAMLEARERARWERLGYDVQPLGIARECVWARKLFSLALFVSRWADTNCPPRPAEMGGGHLLVSNHDRPVMEALCALGWWAERADEPQVFDKVVGLIVPIPPELEAEGDAGGLQR